MPEKRLLYTDPATGNLCVIIPSYNDRLRPPGDTEAALIERCRNRSIPAAIPHVIIDEATIPADRIFRNAWEEQGARIGVNMPKARGIQMDCIRKVRNAELAKLDIPFMQALETGDTAEQQRIAVSKQVLRDIPQTFDLTTPNDTPEELKAMWPSELPKE